MNILLVTHYYSTHRGGIELVAGELAERLATHHRVVWLASDCDPSPDNCTPNLVYIPMRSANVIERLIGLPFPVWGGFSMIRLWKESGSADVIHLHDVGYLGNWLAFVYAKIRRKPIVVTQHVGYIPYRNPVLRGMLKAMHATAGRLMLARADRVIFVSPVVRDYFHSFVRFRRPPLVVHNGVDQEVFWPATGDARVRARRELGLDPAAPVLLFVGRFVEKKGLALLQRLVRRIPDAVWMFAGWGPVDPRRWDVPNVRVFEGLKGSELVPLYHAADLLVLPSVGEGLPLVVQESMSCGTPVLVGEDTATATGAPENLVFRCQVANTETDVERWTLKIAEILTGRIDLASARNAVATFARCRWSWTECASRYASVISQIADDVQPAAGALH